MLNKKVKVLLLDGDTVQTLAVAKSLYENNYHVTLLCEHKLSFGWVSRYSHEKYIAPSASKSSEEYLNYLIKFINKNHYDVLIPLFNDSAEIVSYHKNKFTGLIEVAIPDYEVFIKGHDKNLTMGIAKQLGIPHPRTADLEVLSLKEAAEYCGFPSLIKPNISAGARGITIVNSLQELERSYTNVREEFGPCALQEFIPQDDYQFKCQIFRDRLGNIRASTVQKKYRYFPVTGGSTSCSEIVHEPILTEYAENYLNYIGWNGFADFDFIFDSRDGNFKLMEINPRVPASIRSCFVAGVDYAKLIVADLLHEDLQSYSFREGIILRHFSLEMLWFLFTNKKEAITASPSWFNFFDRNTCYSDGSLDDPLPMLAGVLMGIKKYMNPSFRKSKLSNSK